MAFSPVTSPDKNKNHNYFGATVRLDLWDVVVMMQSNKQILITGMKTARLHHVAFLPPKLKIHKDTKKHTNKKKPSL